MGINAIQTQNLERVLINKIKHSKCIKSTAEGRDQEEETHLEELNFKFSRVKKRKKPYLKEIKPALYYESSKRWSKDNILYLNGVFIRNGRSYTHIQLDCFEMNSTTSMLQLNAIDTLFREFYFEDMKVYFSVGNEYCNGEWERTKLKKFLFDQKEMDLNSQIKTFKFSSKREFLLFDGDEYTSENLRKQIKDQELIIREKERRFRNICAELGMMHEGYCLLKRNYEELKKQQGVGINGEQVFTSNECVICFNEKPNILFANCGHIAICDKCNELLENNKCPECRTSNTIKRKIF